MCRPHLERHLMVGAEVDRLDVAPSPEIPEMDPMALLDSRADFLGRSPLELRRQRPFTCHHVVARQVPPEIIVQLLGPRSISQRPRTSNVSQSMMKTPGGPSVPSLPPPPSVLT